MDERTFTASEVVGAMVDEFKYSVANYLCGIIDDPGDMTSRCVGIQQVAQRLGLEKQYDAAREAE